MPDTPVKCIGSLDHYDAIIRPEDGGEREPAQVQFLSISHHNSPPIDHSPTMREYRSRMTERYSHPCIVGIYVISVTHFLFGSESGGTAPLTGEKRGRA
jgi:hypothetical protein